MNELALFAGAGGGVLAGQLLGWRTVCAVEFDAYCAQVLAQRQNDRTLEAFPIWSDIRSFDGIPWRGIVDIISGGFPCQDISLAGSGAGITGERSGLWKEFARVIGEIRPRFAFIENSPALITRGLDVVLTDLAALGYDAEWMCLSAAECGAHHKRDRIWILAHANGIQCEQGSDKQSGWAEYNRSSETESTNSYCQRKLQPKRSEQNQRRRFGNSNKKTNADINSERLPQPARTRVESIQETTDKLSGGSVNGRITTP